MKPAWRAYEWRNGSADLDLLGLVLDTEIRRNGRTWSGSYRGDGADLIEESTLGLTLLAFDTLSFVSAFERGEP